MILNFSSTAAFKGMPRKTHYVTAKAALRAFTQSVANEVGPYGIRCNCIVPGGIDTELWQSWVRRTADEQGVDFDTHRASCSADAAPRHLHDRATSPTSPCSSPATRAAPSPASPSSSTPAATCSDDEARDEFARTRRTTWTRQWTDRTVPPIPTSISAEAQRYLAAPSTYGTEPEPTDLRDTDAWLRYIDGRNAVITQAVAAMAPADLPVQHSSFELDGVTTYVLRPDHVADSTDTPIYLDSHGGALILGGGDACLAMATPYSLGRT